MHSSYSRSSSFLPSTLLTRLLLNIVWLIHLGSWTIVLPQKSTFKREMSHFSTIVTWKFSIVGWVIGMNTSSIRLLWIDRSYSKSDIRLLLALLLRWAVTPIFCDHKIWMQTICKEHIEQIVKEKYQTQCLITIANHSSFHK
jgi:hypothetical protein